MSTVQTSPLRESASAKAPRHFLWRVHARAHTLRSGLPEVLATDGVSVRRMASQAGQIVYQHFHDAQTASTLVERIESSVTPGVVLQGYSVFDEQESVAILNTGTSQSPGWLAFPDVRTVSGAPAFTGHFSPTLPVRIASQPKLRLVTGASVAWEHRRLVIKAALEQRGSEFLRSEHAFFALDHMSVWTMHAVHHQGGRPRQIELGTASPQREPQRVHAQRMEATFEIEPYLYKEFRRLSGQLWFEVSFDQELFCLPQGWRSFWIESRVEEPPGMVF